MALKVEDLLKGINVVAIADGIKKRADKDARRIAMFFAAVAKRSGELLQELQDPSEFLKEAGDIANLYIKPPKKWSLGDLFGDPFKGARDETRKFAKKWKLDPEFIKEMG